MTSTGHLFHKAALHFIRGDIPWKAATTTMYMALSTVTPNQATAEVIGDITQIASGSGYTTGGKAMTLNDPIVVGTDPYAFAKLYGSDVSWTGFSATAAYAIVYYNPNNGSKYLVGYLDLHDPYDGSPLEGEGGTATVKCPTDGWFQADTP